MLTAKEARELSGVDPRTTKQKFLDEIYHYIKVEARFGERKMVYRIPDRFADQRLIYEVCEDLKIDGYDVSAAYPDYPDIVVRW